jgi:hypothetical protein
VRLKPPHLAKLLVIASDAKQSKTNRKLDCFIAGLLAKLHLYVAEFQFRYNNRSTAIFS